MSTTTAPATIDAIRQAEFERTFESAESKPEGTYRRHPAYGWPVRDDAECMTVEQVEAAKAATRKTKPATARKVCRCSDECTAPTRNLFAQGHDARMVSRLVRQIVATDGEFEEYTLTNAREELRTRGGSANLEAKLDRAAEKATNLALAREIKRMAKESKKSQPEPTPEPQVRRVRAKVGRWEYEGELHEDGVFRYTDNKGRAKADSKFRFIAEVG